MVAHGDAAINTLLTVTVPAIDGKFIYVTGLDLVVSNNATGGVKSVNLKFTSTNLWGWAYLFSEVGTAWVNTIDRSFQFMEPLKSQTAGVPLSIVSPAVNAQAAYSINIYYYYGD